MKLAPVILFAYNRVDHLEKTIIALQKNHLASQSDFYIFCDGANQLKQDDENSVKKVHALVDTIIGFKNVYVVKSFENKGLAKSVIQGVSTILEQEDSIIVLEDDLVTTPDFLTFMNNALSFYKLNTSIFSISGFFHQFPIPQDYNLDVLLLPRASSWGWATWKDRWDKADWNISNYNEFINDTSTVNKFTEGGEDLLQMLKRTKRKKINSWAIIWSKTHTENNAYCLYPKYSKVNNIGTDGSGTNFVSSTNKYNVTFFDNNINLVAINKVDPRIVKKLQSVFKQSYLRKLLNMIENITYTIKSKI